MMLKIIRIHVWMLLTVCLSVQTYGQEEYLRQMEGYSRVIIPSKDSVIYAWFCRPGNKKIKVDETKYYYWFSQNDIKRTRGGYDGKLLHGSYTVYYSNKDLQTKGLFKYGLKTGCWKSWYAGGEIKNKEKWRKGRLVGTACYYYQSGKIERERKISGKNTIVSNYNEEGNLLSKQYYEGDFLAKEKAYQQNEKGKSVEIQSEKQSSKKVKRKEEKTKEEKVKDGKKEKKGERS